MRPQPRPAGPGQESVWDYPRPPRLEAVRDEIRIIFAGAEIVRTRTAFRVLETSHPPVYYLPPSAFRPDALVPASGGSFCEWKGRAVYFDVEASGRRAPRAAWAYPDPTPGFAAIRGFLAVYPGKMGACFVGNEEVLPQSGGFYGGWITSNIVGPFKGDPGTEGW